MDKKNAGIADYISMVKRRKKLLSVVIGGVLILTAIIALVLPPVYRSTAVILIEQQEIPEELVRSTITSYADQRIQVISQRVMTSANLTNIVNKYHLYAKDRKRESMATVLERMRDDIQLEMISADVVDPRSGRPTQATIAFNLSYDNESPELAQKVVNELVSLFLNENSKRREQMAAEASSFLAEEANKLSERISELESRLAMFKEQNVGSLPELAGFNLDLMERTERQLVDTQQRIRSLEERKIYLQSALSQLQPRTLLYGADGERILSAEDRLKSLQAQYVSMAAIYAENHPDRLKMRREIEALRNETGLDQDISVLEKRLEVAITELAAAEEHYSPAHPDVKKAQKAVAQIEKELKNAADVRSTTAARRTKPDNPAYIQTQAELEATEAELRAMKGLRGELRGKLDIYEQRFTRAPLVERDYRELTRDYENALAKYQGIKAKQMQAELAEALEKERKAERFSLIEPPLRPDVPEKPNRVAIFLLGLLFSVGGGIGVVTLVENIDNTVRGSKGVAQLLGKPPIGVIPYIETEQDRIRRAMGRKIFIISIVAGSVLLLVLTHLLFMPLDVLWFVLLRRLGWT